MGQVKTGLGDGKTGLGLDKTSLGQGETGLGQVKISLSQGKPGLGWKIILSKACIGQGMTYRTHKQTMTYTIFYPS